MSILRPLPLKRIASTIRLIAQKPPSSAASPFRSCATAAVFAARRARLREAASLSPLMRVRSILICTPTGCCGSPEH
eukprot:141844-Prymnesium_polylepis.1